MLSSVLGDEPENYPNFLTEQNASFGKLGAQIAFVACSLYTIHGNAIKRTSMLITTNWI